MRVKRREMEIRTQRRIEVIDITEEVLSFLGDIRARDGLLNLFVPHTTAGITINENEEGLLQDLLRLLDHLAPEKGDYLHNRIDDNAHAHLRSVLLGSSVTLPVEEGRPLLGTWQRVLFIEGDGPRQRRIVLTYVGL